MGKTVLLISGKGGVGKSTLAAGIAQSAARKGRRVVLIDGDIGLRSLDLMLGLQDRVLYDMADLVGRRCTLEQALIWHPEYPTLALMVGGQQAKPKDFRPQDLKKILNTLKKRFDLVLVDGPAGLGRGVRNFTGLTDEVLLVATPDPIALRAAEKLASQLYAFGQRPALLLNRVQPDSVLRGEVAQPGMLSLSMDLPLAGLLEENPQVYTALVQGKPLYQLGDAPLNEALDGILARLEGEQKPYPDYVAKVPTRFERFIRWLEK